MHSQIGVANHQLQITHHLPYVFGFILLFFGVLSTIRSSIFFPFLPQNTKLFTHSHTLLAPARSSRDHHTHTPGYSCTIFV